MPNPLRNRLMIPQRNKARQKTAHKPNAPFLCTNKGAFFAEDSLRLMGRLKDDSIDCVFADPPFNIGKKYGPKYSDNRDHVEYMQWSHRWMGECIRVLKPGASLFVYATPTLAIDFASFLKTRMTFRHWIALTMKSGYPIANKLYPAHYALLYLTKGRPKSFNKLRIPIQICRHCGEDIKDYGGHKKHLNAAGVSLTDFWEDTSPNRHTPTKARAGINELKLIIPSRAIEMSTSQGDVILDPFGGGGSTYHAAQLLNRYWLGSEIATFKAAANRIKMAFPNFLRSKPPRLIGSLFKKQVST